MCLAKKTKGQTSLLTMLSIKSSSTKMSRKISVKVVTGAKNTKFVEEGDGSYKVWIPLKPVYMMANEAIVKLFVDHFGVDKSSVIIVSGHKSKNKVVEISQGI